MNLVVPVALASIDGRSVRVLDDKGFLAFDPFQAEAFRLSKARWWTEAGQFIHTYRLAHDIREGKLFHVNPRGHFREVLSQQEANVHSAGEIKAVWSRSTMWQIHWQFRGRSFNVAATTQAMAEMEASAEMERQVAGRNDVVPDGYICRACGYRSYGALSGDALFHCESPLHCLTEDDALSPDFRGYP